MAKNCRCQFWGIQKENRDTTYCPLHQPMQDQVLHSEIAQALYNLELLVDRIGPRLLRVELNERVIGMRHRLKSFCQHDYEADARYEDRWHGILEEMRKKYGGV